MQHQKNRKSPLIPSINENGKLPDPKLQEEITSALNTFFKVYTSGTQEELSYYIKGDEVQTMTGIITFKEVKNLVIKQDESPINIKLTLPLFFKKINQKHKLFIHMN